MERYLHNIIQEYFRNLLLTMITSLEKIKICFLTYLFHDFILYISVISIVIWVCLQSDVGATATVAAAAAAAATA